MSARRLTRGGLVNRDRVLNFTLDGRSYSGFEGDTVGSALLANGVSVLGRSFKYHRPRGIMTAGSEEPNALLTIGDGAFAIPNQRPTVVPLQADLSARTQNAWPTIDFDVGEVNDLLSPFISAGFYYKTFIAGGPYVWRAFEYFIRRAAGLGVASQEPLPARFEKVNAHCDVLIVGGGPAGLTSAITASRSGLRVVLVDEGLTPGSYLAGNDSLQINGESAENWRKATLEHLESLSNVRILTRTTAFGLYDGQVAGLIQRLDPVNPFDLAERYWTLRCKKIILATGSIERPIAFPGNDRPGVMLAGAIATYARKFGVAVGENPIIFTNNDTGYLSAVEMQKLTSRQVTVVDTRREVSTEVLKGAEASGISPILGHGVAGVRGKTGLQSVELVDLKSGHRKVVEADVLGMAGGWSPTIHLASHRGTKPVWSEEELAFLAGDPAPGAHWVLAGAVQGRMDLNRAVTAAGLVAKSICTELGQNVKVEEISISGEILTGKASVEPFWAMPNKYFYRKKAFVDFQHDVTVKDVKQAAQEGFISPEHMKRYTTLGMATDQGKLSNSIGQALLAASQSKEISAVGTTTYRPPFTPVSLGAFTERNTASQWMAERMTPMKPWHECNGAKFMESSDWRRPWFYPEGIEDLTYASRREAFHVRQHVGICDVSSLGKIEVQGPDSAKFMDLIYVGRMSTLKQGRSRYGVMLREDGVVLDDGTVSRIAPDHYFVTTTTVEAPHVMAHFEHLLQVEFKGLDVHVTSVSDVWAAMALAGPKSRTVLENLFGEEAVSNDALPYMSFKEVELTGLPVRIHRISFSGELAYEIYAPARSGVPVWQALVDAGDKQNIGVYGLEALDLLRIEKGFPTGNEIDGRTTLHMLGLEAMAKDDKDYIGRVLRKREGMIDPLVPTLVGLRSVVPDQPLRGGGQLVREHEPDNMHDQIGYVSSAGYSTTLGCYVGIGFVRGGLEKWEGQSIYVADPVRGQHFEAQVVHPCHVDREGVLVRG
ncbi:MAG: 2Fe-2S iron-sulfur cluster-binding protein [Alphaproteobacteria bacterium]